MPLIVFMLVPIAEMWILIEVGGWIGALPTIALVVVTATVGLSLLEETGFIDAIERSPKNKRGLHTGD